VLFLFFYYSLPTLIYPLSLHDALPIFFLPKTEAARSIFSSFDGSPVFLDLTFFTNSDLTTLSLAVSFPVAFRMALFNGKKKTTRSEEHTSELQSRFELVCRLLLEKKNK